MRTLLVFAFLLSSPCLGDIWEDLELLRHIESEMVHVPEEKDRGLRHSEVLKELERHVLLLTKIEKFEAVVSKNYFDSFLWLGLMHAFGATFSTWTPGSDFGFHPGLVFAVLSLDSLLIRAYFRWRRAKLMQARPLLVGRVQRFLRIMDERKIDMGLPIIRMFHTMYENNKTLRDTFDSGPNYESAYKKSRRMSFGTRGVFEATVWSGMCAYYLSKFLGF